ncbi:MAG TPA: glycosyltransferase family 9 protein [Methylomirabilota bacterium]|jgi:ADP-heptose:LPS heptosyltransferase|nr:glycosyltransferase family 9 protein [Methylomirabilota bacterium]
MTLLILRALGLGDLLTAVPALRALAAAFPDHHRVLAAPAYLAELALLTGAIDEVVPTAPLAPLDEALAQADVAVNLHGSGPESHRVLLDVVPGRLISFHHPDVPETTGAPRWRVDEHEMTRWCRLLHESGIPADPRELDLAPPGFAPPGHAPDHAWGATLIHPGAAYASRRWPAERWAAVARAELDAGRPVIVTGGATEVMLARTVARLAGLPNDAVHAGGLSALELAALVGAAGRVVCGDTGVAHLATSLRTPSVVLFGPVSPALWGPPAERTLHRVLWMGTTGDPYGSFPDPGLLEITVADVVAALAALCRQPARPLARAA